jgi:hypothetical protein
MISVNHPPARRPTTWMNPNSRKSPPRAHQPTRRHPQAGSPTSVTLNAQRFPHPYRANTLRESTLHNRRSPPGPRPHPGHATTQATPPPRPRHHPGHAPPGLRPQPGHVSNQATSPTRPRPQPGHVPNQARSPPGPPSQPGHVAARATSPPGQRPDRSTTPTRPPPYVDHGDEGRTGRDRRRTGRSSVKPDFVGALSPHHGSEIRVQNIDDPPFLVHHGDVPPFVEGRARM